MAQSMNLAAKVGREVPALRGYPVPTSSHCSAVILITSYGAASTWLRAGWSTWLMEVSAWLGEVSTWLRGGEHMAHGGEVGNGPECWIPVVTFRGHIFELVVGQYR